AGSLCAEFPGGGDAEFAGPPCATYPGLVTLPAGLVPLPGGAPPFADAGLADSADPAHAETAAVIVSMAATIAAFPVIFIGAYPPYDPGANSILISGVSPRTMVTPRSRDHPELTRKYLF